MNSIMLPHKAATIEDVARMAGVAPSTASGAFSGKKRMSPETRAAILQVASDLHYVPNPHAQRLASGRASHHIDLVSLRLDVGMDARKAQLIQRLLIERGFSAPLHAFGRLSEDEKTGQHELMRDLSRQKPRAIICDMTGMRSEAAADLRRFGEEGGIVVCYGHRSLELPCDQVYFDSRFSTETAVSHLIALGHRDIGIGFPTQVRNIGNRSKAFRTILEAHDLPVREEWILHDNGSPQMANLEGNDVEEAGSRLGEQFLLLPERPTGIFITNDYAALAFMACLGRAGVRVPQDVSVVGHDDRPLARAAWIPLTTITHPAQDIARLVVGMLEDRVNGFSDAPRTVPVRGELKARQSTAYFNVV